MSKGRGRSTSKGWRATMLHGKSAYVGRERSVEPVADAPDLFNNGIDHPIPFDPCLQSNRDVNEAIVGIPGASSISAWTCDSAAVMPEKRSVVLLISHQRGVIP